MQLDIFFFFEKSKNIRVYMYFYVCVYIYEEHSGFKVQYLTAVEMGSFHRKYAACFYGLNAIRFFVKWKILLTSLGR